MFEVPLPLAALCYLSGRIDPWPLLERISTPASSWTRAQLLEDEWSGGVRKVLSQAEPFVSSQPFVCVGEEEYPRALVGVPFAPTVLFYQGNLKLCDEIGVGLVGARCCTPEGLANARRFAAAVSRLGGVVVSGLARGIDTAAHRASGGRTIGVLGHGFDQRGRADLRGLMSWVLAHQGLVVSEFPPHWPPSRHSFPKRNRTIAALSKATVVVQAGKRSGALITARLANEIGRDVLAVPGAMDAPLYAGCLQLISQGAMVVLGERSVIDAVGLSEEASQSRGPVHASALEEALALGGRLEDIADRAGIGFDETFRIVARLEVDGVVVREPGQRYRLADEAR